VDRFDPKKTRRGGVGKTKIVEKKKERGATSFSRFRGKPEEEAKQKRGKVSKKERKADLLRHTTSREERGEKRRPKRGKVKEAVSFNQKGRKRRRKKGEKKERKNAVRNPFFLDDLGKEKVKDQKNQKTLFSPSKKKREGKGEIRAGEEREKRTIHRLLSYLSHPSRGKKE